VQSFLIDLLTNCSAQEVVDGALDNEGGADAIEPGNFPYTVSHLVTQMQHSEEWQSVIACEENGERLTAKLLALLFKYNEELWKSDSFELRS
jgi:hypothetical protein